MSSISVDPETGLAVIVPPSGRALSVMELNAALGNSPYRVTGLHTKR